MDFSGLPRRNASEGRAGRAWAYIKIVSGDEAWSKAPRGCPLNVTVFLPRLPVRNNSRHHVVGGFVEPFRSLLVQVAENLLALGSSSEMNVCSLPAHGMKQTQLLSGGLQRGELDPGAVRAETAYKPAGA